MSNLTSYEAKTELLTVEPSPKNPALLEAAARTLLNRELAENGCNPHLRTPGNLDVHAAVFGPDGELDYYEF